MVVYMVIFVLGVLGWVVVSGSIVELIIVVLIVYVGIENVRIMELIKWWLIVIFVFGFLYGLGFVLVFGEFGLLVG